MARHGLLVVYRERSLPYVFILPHALKPSAA